jgi:hypothetical protein
MALLTKPKDNHPTAKRAAMAMAGVNRARQLTGAVDAAELLRNLN